MITKKELQILASLENAISYNSGNKAAFERLSKKLCRSLRTLLEIPTAEVRYNRGGIAVSGEATLHSDHLYLQVYESALGGGIKVLYRTCKGKKDYTGGKNHFASVSMIAHDLKEFADHLKKFVVRERYRQP